MAVFVLTAGAKNYRVATGPRAPSDLVAVATGANAVQLDWINHSISATFIEIQRSLNGSSWTTVTSTLDADSETYDDTGRVANTLYYYRIRALGTPANSDYSNTATATTDASGDLPQLLFVDRLALALDKVTNDTAQSQAFFASLDAELEELIECSYQYDRAVRSADYALGWYLLKDTDLVTATRYGGKAVGLALSWMRDRHVTSAGTWQDIGDGNGVQTAFTLPGTSIITGTLTVYNIASTDPNGTGGGLVNSSDYSVVGTTLTFNVAPASGRTIWVTCLYNTATLELQQTGDGLGGIAAIDATDSAYPDGYVAVGVATVFDWCSALTGFSESLKDEMGQFLVDLSDLSSNETYAPPYWMCSNYGARRLLCVSLVATVIQGRHVDDETLKDSIISLYGSTLAALFGNPSSAVATLKGGFTGEGASAYGDDTTNSVLIAIAALAATDWDFSPEVPSSDISTWAGEVIRFVIHSTYSTSAIAVNGEDRAGAGVGWGDNSFDPCPIFSNRVLSIASGLSADTTAAAYARYLVANGSGDIRYDAWDLLFRDPTATTTDWTSEPNSIGYTYTVSGRQGIISRTDWSYTKTYLASYNGNRANCDHDQPGPSLILNRGSSQLLIDAADFGHRYNNDPSGPWANFITVHDNQANLQSYPWSTSPLFGTTDSFTKPGIILQATDESSGHLLIAVDAKSYYVNTSNTNNPCTLLERRIVFIPASEYIFVFDLCTTSGSYPKHLRWHTIGTSHPVGSGTFTLSNGTGTTSSLAWNASASTVQAALRLIGGTSYSTCEVYRLTDYSFTDGVNSWATPADASTGDGYWIVKFATGTTVAAMTGTASVGGAIIESYNYHPEGASGARTIQHIVLSSTISGTQQIDQGTNRAFLRVDSPDTLTKTQTRIQTGQFSAVGFCQRMAFRPTTDGTSTRFGTHIQLTNTSTSEVASTYLTGTNSKLHGYKVGQLVVLDKTTAWGTVFSPPEVVAITATGTVNWKVFGLAPSTTYDLTGAVEDTVTTNASGTAVFTTNTTNPSVTIAVYVPPSASFGITLVDVGIATDLVTRHANELSARPTSTIWSWHSTTRPNRAGTDYPDIIIGHHSYAVNPGNYIYRNDTASPGGTVSYTFVGNTDYGVTNAYALGGDGGITVDIDLDGDGDVDYITVVDTSGTIQDAWLMNGSGVLVKQTGYNASGYSNYIDEIVQDIVTGRPTFKIGTYPLPAALTALSDQKLVTLQNNGTTFTVASNVAYPIPSGVPSLVLADVLSRLQATPTDKGRFVCLFLDLDNDGVNELIIAGYFAYVSQRNFAYYLKETSPGTYTDMTVTWGLPRTGTFIHLIEPGTLPRTFVTNNFLHKKIDGTGVPYIFIAGGNTTYGTKAPGMYKWNGSGFTLVTGSMTNLLRDACVSGATVGDPDNYLVNLTACDLTNSERVDLIYHRPLSSMVFLMLNNGSGVFTQYATGAASYLSHYPCWGPYGPTTADVDNNGLLDIPMGGKDITTSGGGHGFSAGRDKFQLFKNATTSSGNYLKIILRRSSTLNRHCVGGYVIVYAAGTSTVLWQTYARHDGLPVHFGLGVRTTVDFVVHWPDGTTTTQTSVATNQTVTVTS